MARKQVYIVKDKVYEAVMPHSEVCVHMRVAGKIMGLKLLSSNAVQLYSVEGTVGAPTYREFSFPILLGEAGVFTDQTGPYIYQ